MADTKKPAAPFETTGSRYGFGNEAATLPPTRAAGKLRAPPQPLLAHRQRQAQRRRPRGRRRLQVPGDRLRVAAAQAQHPAGRRVRQQPGDVAGVARQADGDAVRGVGGLNLEAHG